MSVFGIAINPVLHPQKFLLQRGEYGLGFQTSLEDVPFLRSQPNKLLLQAKVRRLRWWWGSIENELEVKRKGCWLICHSFTWKAAVFFCVMLRSYQRAISCNCIARLSKGFLCHMKLNRSHLWVSLSVCSAVQTPNTQGFWCVGYVKAWGSAVSLGTILHVQLTWPFEQSSVSRIAGWEKGCNTK